MFYDLVSRLRALAGCKEFSSSVLDYFLVSSVHHHHQSCDVTALSDFIAAFGYGSGSSDDENSDMDNGGEDVSTSVTKTDSSKSAKTGKEDKIFSDEDSGNIYQVACVSAISWLDQLVLAGCSIYISTCVMSVNVHDYSQVINNHLYLSSLCC